MTTPTREQVIEWAKEADIDPHDMCEDPQIAMNNIERFATLAMSAGRDQGLREAALICRTTPPEPFRPSIEAAHAIEQLRACGSA